jgi:Mn-dependent DtxR family transcriptional regulator
MKRDLMLMEAILGQLMKSPDPLLGINNIVQGLNVDPAIIRHHLNLLQDKGWVHEAENGGWRLTNRGHDYLEGTPDHGIALLPSK